jgi:ABC-type dipeptide/oligopeptide/nickel transport system permease component
VLLGIATVFGCWGAIGFSGMTGYIHFMQHVASLELGRSYSSFAFFSSLGASDHAAHLAVVALTLVGIVAILAIGRSSDGDRRSFVAAIAVALLVSPIVWLHYMILVYVVVALYRRRLSVAWLIPSLYWILPGEDSHGSTSVIVRMWLVTGLTVVFAALPRIRRAPRPALASR